MTSAVAVLFMLIYFLVGCDPQSEQDNGSVLEFQPLEEDEVYYCCSMGVNRDLPATYCYQGLPRGVVHTWRTVSIMVDLPPEQYDLYEGRDSVEVIEQFESRAFSWNLNIFTGKKSQFSLDPFNSTCLGIKTHQDYTIKLEVIQVNYLRVGIFTLGVLIFFLSKMLSSSTLLYYLMGVCAGTIASVLVLFYLLLKLLPLKRSGVLGVVAGGSTLAFYFFKVFSDYILAIIVNNHQYVFGYLILSAVTSFIVCYRVGPMTDPRSKDLFKWFLQAVALTAIFFSTHLKEFSVTVDILLLSLSNFPVIKWARRIWNMLFKSSSTQIVLLREEKRTQQYDSYQKCLQWLELRQKIIAEDRQCPRFIDELRLRNEDVRAITDLWTDESGSD